jgi:hypothetical protein
LSTDGSVNGDGWWVDDLSITNVMVPGACQGGASGAIFADGFESGTTTAWSFVAP